MANITLSVVVDGLENDDLDMVADKYHKVLSDQQGILPGKVTDCSELDREEDEEEETED
jgi:hypothetical protein